MAGGQQDMNPLQRALIEKAGHDHGFEYVSASTDSQVHMASARHPAQVLVRLDGGRFILSFSALATEQLNNELARSLPELFFGDGVFQAPDQNALAALLRRAAELAHALPNQAVRDFDASLQQELDHLPDELKGTEVERLVRQRVGQQAFRRAMLDYWGGACAVTGVAIPEVLRASHAKPWAECESNAERLDVFNGFLLSANLDALFDRFLISFDSGGQMLISPNISDCDRILLGIDQPQKLRWIASDHLTYLQYHLKQFQVKT